MEWSNLAPKKHSPTHSSLLTSITNLVILWLPQGLADIHHLWLPSGEGGPASVDKPSASTGGFDREIKDFCSNPSKNDAQKCLQDLIYTVYTIMDNIYIYII